VTKGRAWSTTIWFAARLEAYRALGQAEIPAMVIDASEEGCLVISLLENIARRQNRQARQHVIVAVVAAAARF
jgi:ParB-like chromosome segregation protein Spo0J